jgi:hypothetical protein
MTSLYRSHSKKHGIYIYICIIAANDNNQYIQFVCPYCGPIDWNNKYSYSYSITIPYRIAYKMTHQDLNTIALGAIHWYIWKYCSAQNYNWIPTIRFSDDLKKTMPTAIFGNFWSQVLESHKNFICLSYIL